ncbi:arginase family protein [Nonomuraea pusilla]|uniref:arginase family protein n=1 Tax=Nonomuraea pusilla TaxID=46177 RepID=UPI003328FF34
MSRYGPMVGPDFTSLGVGRCDLGDPATFEGADVVIVGAPFDGGTANRPGARFGPMALRQACYLPHDGSRPSLALRVDALRDLRVLEAGDVECYSGDVEGSLAAIEDAVRRICYELPVAGMEVVEVAPPYDHADITAFLGNRVILEALSAMARRRRDDQGGPRWDPTQPLPDGR